MISSFFRENTPHWKNPAQRSSENRVEALWLRPGIFDQGAKVVMILSPPEGGGGYVRKGVYIYIYIHIYIYICRVRERERVEI